MLLSRDTNSSVSHRVCSAKLQIVELLYHSGDIGDVISDVEQLTCIYMFALFTGFVVTYVVLTIVGSFFRGQQMILMWPWDPHMIRIE